MCGLPLRRLYWRRWAFADGAGRLGEFRRTPNSVVLYPSDAVSTERLVALAADHRAMVYIRTSRPKSPVLFSNEEPFEIGGSKMLRSGIDEKLAVVAAGITVGEALKAYNQLAKDNISIRVLDAYSAHSCQRTA